MPQIKQTIRALLSECQTIAVVGLSENPERPSHYVAKYMQDQGYRIIPVNPVIAGSVVLGELCYPSLTAAADALDKKGIKIDLVDCFRRSETILPIAEEAIEIGAQCLWMQLDVINHEAETKARRAGMTVVMDRCIKIEHAYLPS